jgi:lysophospholipase L1-like esterase
VMGTAPGSAQADDARLRADLATVARRTVYFGHQSVGTNILDGVRQLAASQGMALRVAELPAATGLPAGTLAHGFMADNGDPQRKLESFQRALGAGPGGSTDLALLKFCYIDFTPDTDARAVFERYQAVIQGLQASHPGTTFVHATIPLTGVQGGIKGTLKRLLGRAPYGLAENVRREEYNALLRQAYQGKEPLFDVARIESTAPDGRVETFDWNGRAVPALVPAYTSDGGHLNAEGQLVVARELLAVLAAAPIRRASSVSR